jgi:hypothetical protein
LGLIENLFTSAFSLGSTTCFWGDGILTRINEPKGAKAELVSQSGLGNEGQDPR